MTARGVGFLIYLMSRADRFFVMARHRRPKDGVASARLCPAMTDHAFHRSFVWFMLDVPGA